MGQYRVGGGLGDSSRFYKGTKSASADCRHMLAVSEGTLCAFVAAT
jgi:hypothetical protein